MDKNQWFWPATCFIFFHICFPIFLIFPNCFLFFLNFSQILDFIFGNLHCFFWFFPNFSGNMKNCKNLEKIEENRNRIGKLETLITHIFCLIFLRFWLFFTFPVAKCNAFLCVSYFFLISRGFYNFSRSQTIRNKWRLPKMNSEFSLNFLENWTFAKTSKIRKT